MIRKISLTETPALEDLQQRFEIWRGKEQKGRIPEELWKSAAELAREFGVNPVSRALGLDYKRLKRRLVGSGASEVKTSPTTRGPTFVELPMDSLVGKPECVVEFKGVRGTFTMRLAGHNRAAVVALAEVLSRPGS